MAIRRVTRYVVKDWIEDWIDNYMPGPGGNIQTPVTIEYDDGKEGPQVKTRERRVEGCVGDFLGDGYRFYTPHTGGCASPSATLIIHEPIPEPTLVEAVEAYKSVIMNGPPAGREWAAVCDALAREKQKSTR